MELIAIAYVAGILFVAALAKYMGRSPLAAVLLCLLFTPMLCFVLLLALKPNRPYQWQELMAILHRLGADAFISYAEQSGYSRADAVGRALRSLESDDAVRDDLARVWIGAPSDG